MQAIQAVCFDLFSTLVDVGRVPESIGRFTADILGIDRRAWRDACFSSAHVIWQPTDHFQTLLQLAHSIDVRIPAENVRQAVAERQARFDYALCNVEADVLAALRNIRRQGIRLGLISNASSSEVQAWPDSPLSELFEVASISCHCGQVKPELAIYSDTLAQLGVAPENCLFVGDGGSDEHFGAHAAGMKPVLIRHYLQEDEYLERQQKYRAVLYREVRDMAELENLLR